MKLPCPNPNGISSFSPGLRGMSYPGSCAKNDFNPNGVASAFRKTGTTLSGLMMILIRVPRVVTLLQPWADCLCPVGASLTVVANIEMEET